MYFSIGIVLFALLLFLCFGICRKRRAVKKVCSMSSKEKCELLSSLIAPFGYCYDRQTDIFSSRNDAWQRKMGYTSLFDRTAVSFHMVFDYLPVYFSYQNRTWLIEFWKGQYGINTGAEIGVYYADRILSPDEFSTAHFQAVDDPDMLPMSFYLLLNKCALAKVSKQTWWLTTFCMGRFSEPSALGMNALLEFPDRDMAHCFYHALLETGFDQREVRLCGHEIQLFFGGPQDRHYSFFERLQRRWVQFCNRISCRLYLKITAPFCMTADRLLYLYFLLPFAFRKILKPRKYCKCKMKTR